MMKYSCVSFDVGIYKFGFDTRDILHIEPAVAVVKNPGQTSHSLGYVNVSGKFGPVYDIEYFLDPLQIPEDLLPEHYFLFFKPQPDILAAIRLKNLPEFDNCEIFEINDVLADRPIRIAKVREGMVMLLSPENFLKEASLDNLLPELAEIFSKEIQVDVDDPRQNQDQVDDF